jgi:lipid II:glycine glycyltransferase (peptidoglycan interpeptide bridge formation enzyme)|tara:strand:+ start:335 stop:1231 length:897 start_codon:yes stop_codon:yes gene_type:complete
MKPESFKDSDKSPFQSKAWLDNCGADCSLVFNSSRNKGDCAVACISLRGIHSLITPPWALDCGFNGSIKTYCELNEFWLSQPEHIKVIDLPPCSDYENSLTSFAIKNNTSTQFRIQWRHTRQIDITKKLPSNRAKQVRRAAKENIECRLVSNWNMVSTLHKESRIRKDISLNPEQLDKLLDAISQEEYSFAVEAVDPNGNCIASGGFLMLDSNTCLYAFGGQKRGPHSAIASVAMLAKAMGIAKEKGATIFDFGGSEDPGVDRFYKEFGAKRVKKARLIYVVWWLKPILRFIRPDLMP